MQAGIHNRHLPGFTMLVMDNHIIFSAGKIKGDIAIVQVIVRKPLLDHVLLVPCADDKIIEAVGGV